MEKSSNSSASSTNEAPNPEVSAVPRRRAFTAGYKKAILEEVDACTAPGGIGEVVRREGLYSSLRGLREGLRPRFLPRAERTPRSRSFRHSVRCDE